MVEPIVGVVGPCGAGKSTLVAGLKQRGFNGKNIAQEHSYVADMWQRLSRPDILIYLHVSYPLTKQRRNMEWSEAEYDEQLHRLRHARQHADFYLDTDKLDVAQVLDTVIAFLNDNHS